MSVNVKGNSLAENTKMAEILLSELNDKGTTLADACHLYAIMKKEVEDRALTLARELRGESGSAGAAK